MAMTLEWDADDAPQKEPGQFVTTDGRPFTVRLLHHDDNEHLDSFLRHGLSPASKARFGAHHPDVMSTREVCDSIGSDGSLRVVATNENEDIVAYAILDDNLSEEFDRYASYGMKAQLEGPCVRLAPAVADAYQGRRVGSQVLRWTVALAESVGVETIILWGGTHDDNDKGRRLYEKCGFVYAGVFRSSSTEDAVDEHDMYLTTSIVGANP